MHRMKAPKISEIAATPSSIKTNFSPSHRVHVGLALHGSQFLSEEGRETNQAPPSFLLFKGRPRSDSKRQRPVLPDRRTHQFYAAGFSQHSAGLGNRTVDGTPIQD